MGTYRGNADKVMADARKIARRLRTTDVTVQQLMHEYRCAYPTMMRAVRAHIPLKEWRQIKRRKLLKFGMKTRFKKGHVPWTKGMKGLCFPGSRATQFKKGQVPINLQPIGTVRIRKFMRGRLHSRFIKVADNRRPGDWIPYAHYVWQRVNGPIPKGLLVVHIDGDALNDSLENLRLVDRREHLRLQYERDPSIIKRRIRSSIKTRRRNRALKRKERERQLKFERQAQRLARRETEDREKVESGIAELKGPTVTWWECIGCGCEFDYEPIGICPKCNGFRFGRITQRKVA